MYDQLQEMGPIDYLCIEFPEGSLRSSALPLLLDLVDRRIIRVLDIMFVRCGQDGSVFTLDGGELERSGLGAFHGAASGLLGGDDLRDVGAHLVAGGRIAIQDLLAALDATEPSGAPAIFSVR